jgi:serine carboxypeptidase 1
VDFYNILRSENDSIKLTNLRMDRLKNGKLARLYRRHVGQFQSDPLADLMNGPIRDKLRVIPKDVQWGGQSADVFMYLQEDFMRPVTNIVETLLNTTSLRVIVYSGQLDLIVATPGTEAWVKRLAWPGIKDFLAANRRPVSTASSKTAAFVKSYKNLSFYWVLRAGHMVPMDAGETGLEMLKEILGSSRH